MDLVIGSSSQLAQYFPDDYVKISSRNVDFKYLKNNNWDSVYITFAEQRIYDRDIDFITPNYQYTLQIIEALLGRANKIVCYTSCELWNELSGYIGLETAPKFNLKNEYAISKFLLWNKVMDRRKQDPEYRKVCFMHPFYFNSTTRSNYFLFGKIFDSIINKRKIEVTNLNFYRDMVHAKFVAAKSIEAKQDAMIGSGKLINIRNFIIDLYKMNNLNYNDYVKEEMLKYNDKEKLIMAKVDWDYSYQNLLTDTQADIIKMMEK